MALVKDVNISLVTRILKHRLTGPTKIDVTILDVTSDHNQPITQNFGRFIGYFSRRPNGDPCFILFARAEPLGEIDYMFVFYIRSQVKNVQASEKKGFNSSLPGLFTSPPTIETSVILIQSDAPKTCDLSILLQTVEFSISPALMTNFTPRQIINAHKGSSLVCFNPTIKFPKCNILSTSENAELLWSYMRRMNLKIVKTSDGRLPKVIPRDFDIVVTKYASHLIYLIHHSWIKTIMILLPHPAQFEFAEDAQSFIEALKCALKPYKPKYIGATRFYGSVDQTCESSSILKACILAVMSSNNPFTTIKQSDVDAIVRISDMESVLRSSDEMRSNSQEVELNEDDLSEPATSQASYNLADDDSTVITDIRFDGPEGDPEILSVQRGNSASQETVIFSESQLALELSLYSGIRPVMRSLLDLKDPPIHVLQPKQDPFGELLEDVEFFYHALVHLSGLWHCHTTVNVHQPLRLNILNQDVKLNMQTRFIIVPVIDVNLTVLIIIDTQTEDWGFVCPTNEAVKDHEYFYDIESTIRRNCKALEDMHGFPIMLTSVFHQQYPLIHLLMGVFYLGKLFNYSVSLPSKIIYGEREFRGYCYRACLQLQLVNQQYNLDHNLIKPGGYLKAVAYRNISSPLAYDRSVVPSDQCAFCKKRGFKNLGRHMSMQHGGQSSAANDKRYNRD